MFRSAQLVRTGVASQACALHLASRAPEVFVCCTLKLFFVLLESVLFSLLVEEKCFLIVLILVAIWISLEHRAAGNRGCVCEQGGTTYVLAGCAFNCLSLPPKATVMRIRGHS